jgi:aryl-alcohol dehydrogenase-like predicted oxidoreductase
VNEASRRLGRTGLVVSRICLGLAAIGRPAYITLGRASDLGSYRGVDVLRPRASRCRLRRRRALRGRGPIVWATWNLLERSATEALQRAHQRGLGVIVKEVLANGRLSTAGGVQELVDLSLDRGMTPDVVAIASALDQPWADVVLSGAVTSDQLRSNVTSLDFAIDADLGSRLQTLAEPAQ